MPIEKITIARNDEVYECFPCLCRTNSDKLITIYRESDSHGAGEFTHLVLRSSTDDGHTWSDRQVLIEGTKEDGILFKWNCARIVQLQDGRLCALCDGYPVPPGEAKTMDSRVFLWFSEDDGETWSAPQETPIFGIVPDKLIETSTGAWLISTHAREEGDRPVQYLHRSEDQGETWSDEIVICGQEGLYPAEASIVELPDRTLVCYMRENSGTGLCGPKCISGDDGKTWDGPYETLMGGCHRPVAGFLPSGEIMVTYRHVPGAKSPWARNLFAFRESVDSARATERSEQGGIILPIDHDRSAHSDSSYTGWCVLPDDSIFVVNYINDDAPMAQIRGYRFTEDEF